MLDDEATFGTSWGATELLSTNFAPQPPSDLIGANNNYDLLYGSHRATANAIVGGELAYIANTDSSAALQDAAAQVAIWDIEQGGSGTGLMDSSVLELVAHSDLMVAAWRPVGPSVATHLRCEHLQWSMRAEPTAWELSA